MTGLDLLPPGQRRLFIGGSWRDAAEDEIFDVLDPADGSVLAQVADGTVADAVDALDAAVEAQPSWAATPPRDRGEILRSAFELIGDRADDLAHLMSLEMGKTVKEAKGEVAYGNEFFRWYAEEAVRIHGRWMQAPAGGSRLLTIKKPVGPCLFVTPWNFPIAMGTRKIGPAVAAGCTMVVKPAQQTPLTMLALAAILAEAGLPDGVLNVVPTTRAGRPEQDAPGRRAAAQGQLHRLDRHRPGHGAAVRRPAAAGQHGARRQRAVRGVRRRRPRRRGRGRDGRQDAQHGRGLHGRQPVPGAQLGRRRVRAAAGGPDGGAGRRPRPGRGCRRRAADRREGRRVGLAAGHRRGPRRRQGADRRHRRRRRRVLLPADGARRRTGRTRRSTARRSSGRSRRSRPSRPRTRRSSGPTTPSTAWRPTSSPATWPGPSGSRSGSTTAWSASTPAWSPTRRRRSAASRPAGSGARAASRGSRSTSRRPT